MQVSEVMSSRVRLASPEQTLRAVAESMAEIDAGALPVGDADRLVGMITDRDIVVRAVCKGLNPENTKVRDVMTADVNYCFEDDDLDEVAKKMADLRVRRLPVLNADKHLVGIVSLGDVSLNTPPQESGDALRDISS